MNQIDEATLLQRLRNGDEDAFELMVRVYGGRMLAATRLHLPLELAGLALAGGTYLHAMRQPLRPDAVLAGASSNR